MKITHVRVRKLETGPGYNNFAVEAEAPVGDGQDPVDIREQLTMWVEAQIRGKREVETLREHVDYLRNETKSLEDQRDRLNREIASGRMVIKQHEKIRQIAEREGLDVPDALADPLPF